MDRATVAAINNVRPANSEISSHDVVRISSLRATLGWVFFIDWKGAVRKIHALPANGFAELAIAKTASATSGYKNQHKAEFAKVRAIDAWRRRRRQRMKKPAVKLVLANQNS
jgi:hypothetical protein